MSNSKEHTIKAILEHPLETDDDYRHMGTLVDCGDLEEERLIEQVLDGLGDDFTPENFKKALAEARARLPKPDLVFEPDESEAP